MQFGLYDADLAPDGGWKLMDAEGLRKTIEWYKTVDTKWWDVGTDSSLAPHPTPAEVVSASASAAK